MKEGFEFCCAVFMSECHSHLFLRHFVNGGKRTIGTSKAATGIMHMESGVEEADGYKSEVIFIAQILVFLYCHCISLSFLYYSFVL